jgi:hypothetical protein
VSAAAQTSSTTAPGATSPATTATTGTTAVASPGTGTTTTTAPPRAPTTDDLVLLGYLQSVELAAVQIYGNAINSKQLTGDPLSWAGAFEQHHLDHSQAMAAQGGKSATGVTNQSVLDQFGALLQAAQGGNGVMDVLFQLETALASTYVLMLGLVQATRGAQSLASVQPIEARHAVVWGQALNRDLSSYVPTVENIAYAITPTNAPILRK